MLYGVRRRHQILILKKDLESQNHCAFAFSLAVFGRPFYPQETKTKNPWQKIKNYHLTRNCCFSF